MHSAVLYRLTWLASEVLGERSETTQLFANVSRAFTLEQHLQGQRMSGAMTHRDGACKAHEPACRPCGLRTHQPRSFSRSRAPCGARMATFRS